MFHAHDAEAFLVATGWARGDDLPDGREFWTWDGNGWQAHIYRRAGTIYVVKARVFVWGALPGAVEYSWEIPCGTGGLNEIHHVGDIPRLITHNPSLAYVLTCARLTLLGGGEHAGPARVQFPPSLKDVSSTRVFHWSVPNNVSIWLKYQDTSVSKGARSQFFEVSHWRDYAFHWKTEMAESPAGTRRLYHHAGRRFGSSAVITVAHHNMTTVDFKDGLRGSASATFKSRLHTDEIVFLHFWLHRFGKHQYFPGSVPRLREVYARVCHECPHTKFATGRLQVGKHRCLD